MLTSAAIGRSLSCAAQRLMPRSIALSAATQCANRGVSYRAQCAQNVSKSKNKEEEKDNEKPKSMWFNPECCLDPCPDLLPRYDELYYKPSDKLKRKYTQTWIECPRVRITPKKICCYKKAIPPPFKRRVFKRRTAAEECKPRPTDLMPCKSQEMRGKCPTVMLPGCFPARIPPKCKRLTQKANCRKICTPYPSFSECSRKKLRPLRAVECRCLDIPSRCEVWEQFRRAETMKKV